MKIKVTQKHIENGIPRNLLCCPIALAAVEQLGPELFWSESQARVSDQYLTICSKTGRGSKCFRLPTEAQKFVASFDGNRPVEPFEFEVIDGC